MPPPCAPDEHEFFIAYLTADPARGQGRIAFRAILFPRSRRRRLLLRPRIGNLGTCCLRHASPSVLLFATTPNTRRLKQVSTRTSDGISTDFLDSMPVPRYAYVVFLSLLDSLIAGYLLGESQGDSFPVIL